MQAKVGDTSVASQISAATADSITGLSASGTTVTYTKGDGSTGTITTQDTTYSKMRGATPDGLGGSGGLVPAPAPGTHNYFLRGDATWASPTVDQLNTARAIQTNLASTDSASFDGSADITPGVTGTLPIANGGTGATTAADARTNLGAVNKAGDTMTGTLSIRNIDTTETTWAGFHCYRYNESLGDVRYVQMGIDSSGDGSIFYYDGSKTQLNAIKMTDTYTTIQKPLVLPSNMYGTSLPTAGTKGRVFFKKV